MAANPPGRGDGAASIPSLRKPEARRLSSSVSTARLSVASNDVSFGEPGVGGVGGQTKGSGGADVSGARQVGSRSSELALHFFRNLQLIFTDGRREAGASLPQNSCLFNLAAN